jgi:Protein of unknown function (DUF2786)
MASVLDRVRKLLALAASSNAHEARNAAYLAAKLIREHGLELHEPATPRRVTPTPRRTPGATRRTTPSAQRRTPGSKRGVRAVPDAPVPIESPLGGDCVVCGRRYRAGSEILWSQADGGIHPACFDDWLRRSTKR